MLGSAPLHGQAHYEPYFSMPDSTLVSDRVELETGVVNDVAASVRGIRVLPSYDLLTTRTDWMLIGRYGLGRELKVKVDRWGIGKVGFDQGWEFGVRVTMGQLNQFASDGISSVVLGAKQIVLDDKAVTLGLLLPVADAGSAGVSVGYMVTARVGEYIATLPVAGQLIAATPLLREIRGWEIGHWFNLGFLSGYAGDARWYQPAVGSLAETRLRRWPFASFDLIGTILEFDGQKAGVNARVKYESDWFVAGFTRGMFGLTKQGGYGIFATARWSPNWRLRN